MINIDNYIKLQNLRSKIISEYEAFKNIKGLIIGKPVDETYYEEYKEMYLKIIQDEYHLNNLFVGFNYNFGHTAPMCILPIGINVKISQDGIIEFLESATKEDK